MKVADMELRPETIEAAAFVADVDTAVHPDDPEDPEMLRHSWSMTGPRASLAENPACEPRSECVRRGEMISASFMAITW